jgi:hypothetical protein
MVPLRAYETDARFGLLWFGLIEFLNPLSREETKVCNRKLKSIYKKIQREIQSQSRKVHVEDEPPISLIEQPESRDHKS